VTTIHWAYTLVPPVPDLPVPLPPVPLPPLPLPVSVPGVYYRGSRLAPGPSFSLADAAGQVRVWFSDGASFDLILARLNERCPQRPRWTRRAVRNLLLATAPREPAPAKLAS
jgi:hypothetical protein